MGKSNGAAIGAIVGGLLGLALGAWLGDLLGGVLGGLMLGGLIGLVVQNRGRPPHSGATRTVAHDAYPAHLGIGAMGLAAHQVHILSGEPGVTAETCAVEPAGSDFGGADCGSADSGGGGGGD